MSREEREKNRREQRKAGIDGYLKRFKLDIPRYKESIRELESKITPLENWPPDSWEAKLIKGENNLLQMQIDLFKKRIAYCEEALEKYKNHKG